MHRFEVVKSIAILTYLLSIYSSYTPY